MTFMGYPNEVTPATVLSYSTALQARLNDYLSANKLSQSDFAKQVGMSPAMVSKYLTAGKTNAEGEVQTPVGDIPKFERLVEDVLKAAERRKASNLELLETEVSRDINAAVEIIRKTNDFGLVSGAAGLGKTCGVKLYSKNNPTSVVVDIKAWGRNGRDIERALFAEIEPRKWTGRSKADYLVSHFRDSNRPILVDNAHRLKTSGLNWLFDFYDSTNCPICLFGNPEILDQIRRNDQHFSRIGLHQSISQKPGAYELAQKLIAQIAPEFAPIIELAVKVVESRGHLRALRKTLALAHEFAQRPSFRDKGKPEDLHDRAFRAAHTKLIRDYSL